MFKTNAKFKFNKKKSQFNQIIITHLYMYKKTKRILSFSSSVTMTYQEGTFLQVVNSPYRKGLIISVRKGYCQYHISPKQSQYKINYSSLA